MSTDPLDEVFTLEDRLYKEGYSQGFEDGAWAGRIEGRSLGMEKGFVKFCEAARLSGKSLVWLNRLPKRHDTRHSSSDDPTLSSPAAETTASSSEAQKAKTGCTLPPLPNNPRLEKNIRVLYALVEADTFSVENTDEAVQDFDDRVKRAQGKAKVVELAIQRA